MLNKYQNFIFDLDGTIINSSQEILNCLKKSYIDSNYIVDDSRFTSDVIGPPIKTIISNITPELSNEQKISEIISNFRKIYDNDENDISVMYDGIYDLLLNLKQDNKKLFIATFKPKIPTMRLIKKFNLNMFDDIYTIDKFDKHITKVQMLENIINTYGLNKYETVMIGDAASDMIAARDNDIDGIGALWGYGDDKTNLINTAIYIINNVKELYYAFS